MVLPGSGISRLLVTSPLAGSYVYGCRNPFFVSLDHKYDANIQVVGIQIQ